MIWDFDKRRNVKMIELMALDSPYMDIYPAEFQTEDDGTMTFVYSDLGVNPKQLEKLMKLTVVLEGKHLKMACIRGQHVFRDEYDGDGNPEIWTETLVEFK